ncbi:MAG: hypothetical protein R3321_09730, partial [Nitrososphaeraceae archaeon]|nr:hypothetical protein [Nitrososphaeraceae archaeon]
MAEKKLNELPNGIVKSATATGSGEVTDINFGGLVAPNMADPVADTDGANKQWSLANLIPSQSTPDVTYIASNADFDPFRSGGLISIPATDTIVLLALIDIGTDQVKLSPGCILRGIGSNECGLVTTSTSPLLYHDTARGNDT